MAPVVPNPKRIKSFRTEADFEKWMRTNHAREPELWLKVHKKASGLPSVTVQQALDVALCWGWIDGIRKSYDAQSFLQRFTPRRAKSIWSQINREHVARLIEQKRMTPHGLEQVEAAKADGRWQSAYAGGRAMEVPADLIAAIRAEPKAFKHFQTLNKANLYAMSFRLANLKTQAGREKRIVAFVEMLKRGETLHPNGRKA